MSVSGRSHYRGSLPVICFRRATSWASSRAFHVCVCARVIYIERCCHVCAVCSRTYVKELYSTWQHGADSVAFYLLKVISALRSMSYKWGNLVVARAGWMDTEEEWSEMKVEVNIQPSDVSLSLIRYYDFSYLIVVVLTRLITGKRRQFRFCNDLLLFSVYGHS